MTTTPTVQDFSATFFQHQGRWMIATSAIVEDGTECSVSKKNGTSKRVVLDAYVTGIPDRNGNPIHLYTFHEVKVSEPHQTARPTGLRRGFPSGWSHASQRRSGRRHACVTGGNCSSFGDSTSCGGYDCDGM